MARRRNDPLPVTETVRCDFCGNDVPYGHNHWHHSRRVRGSTAMICEGCDAWDGLVPTIATLAVFETFKIPLSYNGKGNLVVPR